MPANLTGRQRAEFHVVAYEPNRPQQRAECNVTVDLVLPGTALPTVIPMPIREGEAMGPASTNNEVTIIYIFLILREWKCRNGENNLKNLNLVCDNLLNLARMFINLCG